MSTPLRDWPSAVLRALAREPTVVRVVLLSPRGSVPREPGAGMLVTARGTEGTVGGGRLEWQAMGAARAMLTETAVPVRIVHAVLGPDLGQCCGGVVDLWIERFTREQHGVLEKAAQAARLGAAVLVTSIAGNRLERRLLHHASAGVAVEADADHDAHRLLRASRSAALPHLRRGAPEEACLLERLDDGLPQLWLYGAGHVGQALARIVAELPLCLTWIDSRGEQFPAGTPAAVRTLTLPDPTSSVADAPPGSRFLVMTHSHPLDYELCRAILLRADFAWAGVIGSASKAARFRSRLRREGVAASQVARLVCPIGVGGIDSKWPGAIAVSVAAQLLSEVGDLAVRAPAGPRTSSDACTVAACGACEPAVTLEHHR